MASELGKAYLQVVPTTKGIKGSLEGIMNKEGGDAGISAGKMFGGKFIGMLGALGIGAALVGVIKSSLDEGGALQQSLGGIETLFKDSSDKVIENANNAWKTSGLSANEYMETATSFSASLLQGLGGDTEKAAEITDMAIQDMSDNANKMGTDMESIQNAYQGFAKQNYTMLDNLKLGYGGTKSEMERLLADAEKITGVHYDINNLSDVYEAIHVIQGELDITGTTAKEAATTLSGSASAVQASWKNLLGQMALGGDLEEPLKNLVESASNFLFNNLIPMIGNIVSKLPSMIFDAIPVVVPALLKAGVELLAHIIEGVVTSIPHLIQAIKDLAQQVIDFFKNVDWGEVGEYIVRGIGDGLAAMGGWLWEQAKSLGNGLKDGFCDLFGIHSPSKWAKNMIGANIVAGIGQGMTNKKAKKTISGSVLGVQDIIKNIYKKGKNLPNIIPSTFNTFKKLTKVTPKKTTSSAVSTAQGGGNYYGGGGSGTPSAPKKETKAKVSKLKTVAQKQRPFYMFDIDGYKFGLATAHSIGQASVKVNERNSRR